MTAPRSRPPRRSPRQTDRGRAAVPVGVAARRLACEILGQVIHSRQPLDDSLDADRGPAGLAELSDKDRALVRAILGTALRQRGRIAAILDRLLERPIPEKSGAVLDLLHVAATQILFMEVPDRAAVATAMEIAGADPRIRRYKGLVNAVLRRAARDRETLLAETDQPWRTAPVWMFARWQKAHGEETAQAIARMHLHEPNLDICVKANPDLWAERLGATRIAGNTLRLTGHRGRVDALPGYADGAWWVQDAAASLPARLIGDVAGKRVADLCAAPGGKTAQLAAAGAAVTAVDISETRLERLRANLARLGLLAEIVAADLLTFEPATPFDAILLDAPCTATGTIRRHPEVAWNRRKEDIAAFAERQAALLERAAGWLAPGGVLVYCTCSLEPEEGETRIAAFLAERPEFRRVPIDENETGVPGSVTDAGDLRTLPCLLPREPAAGGGLDGFFAARLKRV